jgi:UDP-N-acetylmuramoyl-L-alanyl-D-glutamate--2,6-diaminopimelate ligase
LIAGLDVLKVRGDISRPIDDICYDSRKCRAGSLFVAVPGLKFDGHDYIPQAVGL